MVMVILITCVIAGHPRLATVAPPKLAAYFSVFFTVLLLCFHMQQCILSPCVLFLEINEDNDDCWV